MSNSILTRGGNYLQIFNSAIRVNKNLKKWKQAESETSAKDDDPDAISLSDFLSLSSRDFNIYLNKTVKKAFKKNGWLVEEDGVEIIYAINTDYSVHVYGSPLKLKFEYYPFIRVGRFKYSDDSVLFYRLVTRPGSQGYFLALITLEEFDSLCKTIDYSVLPQLNAIKYGKP